MQSIRFIREPSTPTGAATSITLADGTKKMAVLLYRPRPGGTVQAVSRPRAKSMDVFYRDNMLTVIDFTVRREFSSVAAVHTFKHRHAKDVNGRGTFMSTMGGRFASIVAGNNWVLRVLDYKDEGIGLYIFYEAQGPEMVTLGGT